MTASLTSQRFRPPAGPGGSPRSGPERPPADHDPAGGDVQRGPDGAVALAALLAEFEEMPAKPSAAMRVLWVATGSRSSARELGAAVAEDPALSARVMRMANSAYYGLSGRVGSAAFAVTVLGFETVRALAAIGAATGSSGDALTLPADFWSHAALTSIGAGLVAERCGAARPDAFSVGLLHDLGRALLHRLAERTFGEATLGIAEPPASYVANLLALERERFGADHAEVAARLLASWRFPEPFVTAVAHQHDASPDPANKLLVALTAGEAIAEVAGGVAGPAEASSRLAAAGIAADQIVELAERVHSEGQALAAGLAELI